MDLEGRGLEGTGLRVIEVHFSGGNEENDKKPQSG
jgi:hypothetical protein